MTWACHLSGKRSCSLNLSVAPKAGTCQTEAVRQCASDTSQLSGFTSRLLLMLVKTTEKHDSYMTCKLLWSTDLKTQIKILILSPHLFAFFLPKIFYYLKSLRWKSHFILSSNDMFILIFFKLMFCIWKVVKYLYQKIKLRNSWPGNEMYKFL